MKRLRFIFIVLVFITTFVFSTISHPVQAQEETIILISTPEELSKIGNHEDYQLNGHYQLMNEIDMSSFANWTPIGTRLGRFSGTFDGNGHTISNLIVNDPMLD